MACSDPTFVYTTYNLNKPRPWLSLRDKASQFTLKTASFTGCNQRPLELNESARFERYLMDPASRDDRFLSCYL